jgi:hypothetical protein
LTGSGSSPSAALKTGLETGDAATSATAFFATSAGAWGGAGRIGVAPATPSPRLSSRETLIDSTSPPGARTDVSTSVAPAPVTLVIRMSPVENSQAPWVVGPAMNST